MSTNRLDIFDPTHKETLIVIFREAFPGEFFSLGKKLSKLNLLSKEHAKYGDGFFSHCGPGMAGSRYKSLTSGN